MAIITEAATKEKRCRLMVKPAEIQNEPGPDLSRYPSTFTEWLEENPGFTFYELCWREQPVESELVSVASVKDIDTYSSCRAELCRKTHADLTEIETCVNEQALLMVNSHRLETH